MRTHRTWATLGSAYGQDILHALIMPTPREQEETTEADEGSEKDDDDQPSDVEKSGEEDGEEEEDEASEDNEAKNGDAGEGKTDATVTDAEGETDDVAAGTATNMTADTDGGSTMKTSDEIDTDIRNYDYAKLKVLVQKSMEKKPPEVMPRLNLTSVPRKNRKQIRSMSKHLYRIKLDQRHLN